jgi:hypothetical protein
MFGKLTARVDRVEWMTMNVRTDLQGIDWAAWLERWEEQQTADVPGR